MLFYELATYHPFDDQQKAVVNQISYAWQKFGSQLYTRENNLCHFTASSWIINKSCTHALMIYHNIYQSWSWTGGHNDGDTDFLSVACREAMEETGLSQVNALYPLPIRWDTLCVPTHIKHGKTVSSHLHLNATYLLSADEREPLHLCAGENSAVQWIPLQQISSYCNEPAMLPIYQWLCENSKKYVFIKGEHTTKG